MRYITTGNASDAKEWVKDLKIANEDKRKIKNFIRRFPYLTLYKRQCVDPDPEWMRNSGEIFLGVYSDMPGYHFGSMDGVEYLDEWEYQKYEERYYILEDGLPGVPEFPPHCGAFDKITMEHAQLRIIASQYEEGEFLAVISGNGIDSGVYRFQYGDIREAGEAQGEGFLETASVMRIFPSYYEMFNRVTKIGFSDGTIVDAKSVKCD